MGRGARGVSFDRGKLVEKRGETAHQLFHQVSFDKKDDHFCSVPIRNRRGSTRRAWGNLPRRHDAIKTKMYIKI